MSRCHGLSSAVTDRPRQPRWGLTHLSTVRPALVAPLLRDPSARVVRQVGVALRPFAGALDAEPLWRLLSDPRRVHRPAYALLHRRGGWDALRAALVLAAGSDAPLARRARADVVAWVRHGVDPTGRAPGDLAALARTAVASGGLDGHTAELLAARPASAYG